MIHRALYIITLCIISTSFSCSSDEDNLNKICKPLGLYSQTDGDSLTFGRDAAGLVQTVDWYANKLRFEFTYDNSKQLISVIIKFDRGNGAAYRSYDIGWVAGKPASLKEYGRDHEGEPLETIFYHDAKGRLVKREVILPSAIAVTRYEYDNSDNVTNIYYSGLDPINETLGRELVSFDSEPRFFEQDEQLHTYFIYLYGEQPSKNNVLKSKVHMPNAYSGHYGNPITRTYTVNYSKDRRVSTSRLVGQVSQSNWELQFHGARYECK